MGKLIIIAGGARSGTSLVSSLFDGNPGMLAINDEASFLTNTQVTACAS